MPVTPENHQSVSGAEAHHLTLGQSPPHSKNILRASSNTNLGFLSDRVLISIPQPKIYSVGDLLLMAGVAIFLVETSLKAWASRGGARRIRNEAEPSRGT